MPFSGLTLMIAAGVLILGMVALWYLKWREPIAVGHPGGGGEWDKDGNANDIQGHKDTFDGFFLGGGRVGEALTTNNNWGLCFAFANALWYYCFLGFYYGPFAVLLQLPWSAAVIGIAFILARYIKATEYGTVHGFINHQFGRKAALLAATATVIGYTINVGFELFYSSYLIANANGLGELGLLLAIFLSLFVAGYCLAGGYRANVKTDKYQNALGVIASVALILFLTPAFTSATGSPFFWSSKAAFDSPPWHFVLGIAVFSFFFNFVDMANWQSIAANRKLDPDLLKNISRGFVISALLQLLAPALCGVSELFSRPLLPELPMTSTSQRRYR